MTQLNNGIKSISNIGLLDVDTNIAYSFLASREVTFNTNLEEEVVNASSLLGVDNPVLSVIASEDPQLQFNVPVKSPEAIGLKLGYKMADSASGVDVDFIFNRTLVPTQNAYAALGAGFEGEGITINEAGAHGSVKRGNKYTILTQSADFATFDPAATTDEFAIGADGAFGISDNLIDGDSAVTIFVPYTLQDVYILTETRFSNLTLAATFIMHNNDLVQIKFDGASPVLDGNSINFGETNIELMFRSLFTGAQCRPYTLSYQGKAMRCVD